jgi:TonB family protein
MPTSEAPTEVNEPRGPAETGPQAEDSAHESSITGSILGLDTFSSRDLEPRAPEPRDERSQIPEPGEPQANGAAASPARGSRWVDYETHELLEMISELEDERRWARLREGMLWAVLVHIILLSCLTWIPRYVFKAPKIDDFDLIKQHEDQTYLDQLPDALHQLQKAKVAPKPLTNKPLIDKQTMDELKREAQQAPPPPPTAQQQPTPEPPKQQAAQPIPPSPHSQEPEAPRPQAVPARPSFAMGSQNPADQLRQDMQNAMRGQGQGSSDQPSGGLSMHPGAGTGGVQILSDTQGVDFSAWLQRWHYITQRTWDPLIPDEVNPPILKQGVVVIHFKVLPNGQVTDMMLDGPSGDTGLDRAAWGAITGSSYPALPREFHGPYLELRAYFLYNEQPQ